MLLIIDTVIEENSCNVTVCDDFGRVEVEIKDGHCSATQDVARVLLIGMIYKSHQHYLTIENIDGSCKFYIFEYIF